MRALIKSTLNHIEKYHTKVVFLNENLQSKTKKRDCDSVKKWIEKEHQPRNRNTEGERVEEREKFEKTSANERKVGQIIPINKFVANS